jgi:hypothetical protein
MKSRKAKTKANDKDDLAASDDGGDSVNVSSPI